MGRCFTWFPNWLVQENPIYTTIWGILQESGDFTWKVSDFEELVGEVNHTTESVTDLFSFVELDELLNLKSQA